MNNTKHYDNNINSNYYNLFMKKILFFIMMLGLMSTAFSGTLLIDQDVVISNYEEGALTTSLRFDIVGGVGNKVLGNATGDFKLEFQDVQESVFLIISNYQSNTSINMSYLFEGGVGITHQELTMEEVGDYYFEIKSSYNGEDGQLLIALPYLTTASLFVKSSQLDEKAIFTPLIAGVVELMQINISVWIIMYYVFITILIVGTIFGIIWGAKKWYDFTKEHNIYGKAKGSKR